jgi:hypothetical protein
MGKQMKKKIRLTQEDIDLISCKIRAEGFNYYFNNYGADEKLQKLIGKEISNFCNATLNLEKALLELGIELI